MVFTKGAHECIQKIPGIFDISKKANFTEIAGTLEVVLFSPSNFGIWCITTLLTHTM